MQPFWNAINIVNANVTINVVSTPEEGKYELGTIDVINLNNIDIDTLEYGEVSAQGGQGAFEYIKESVQLALDGKVHALATTPINKESLKAAMFHILVIRKC